MQTNSAMVAPCLNSAAQCGKGLTPSATKRVSRYYRVSWDSNISTRCFVTPKNNKGEENKDKDL